MKLPIRLVVSAFASGLTIALATGCQAPPPAVSIDNDDIGGVVASENGPEAGVWVIAETDDLDTRFVRVAVTDEAGRYVVPDLPEARYQLWARRYGLVDSTHVEASPGDQVDLSAAQAPDPTSAAQIYPAAYWYSMMALPNEQELTHLEGGLNEYLTTMKNMGCIGCHQLGQQSTRTMPESLGHFESSEDAWLRRISSGQAGQQMAGQITGRLGGVPLKYLADWTDRVATGGPRRHSRNAQRGSNATSWQRSETGGARRSICTT